MYHAFAIVLDILFPIMRQFLPSTEFFHVEPKRKIPTCVIDESLSKHSSQRHLFAMVLRNFMLRLVVVNAAYNHRVFFGHGVRCVSQQRVGQVMSNVAVNHLFHESILLLCHERFKYWRHFDSCRPCWLSTYCFNDFTQRTVIVCIVFFQRLSFFDCPTPTCVAVAVRGWRHVGQPQCFPTECP